MSEFTDGYVLLAADNEKLQASLKALDEKGIPYILHRLNAKYLGLFIDFAGTNQFYKNWLADCSKQFPIMYFANFDEGWSYELYTNSQVISQISVRYTIDYIMVCELIEKELGQDGADYQARHNGELDTYYTRIRSSIEYKQAIEAMYSNLNLGAFKVFGLDKNEIKQLKALLRPNLYLVHENGIWKQESEFKEIIGIPEMGWKSYRYLKRDKDEGNS
jgi:hypothetical protein